MVYFPNFAGPYELIFGFLTKIFQRKIQEENRGGGEGVDLKSLSPSRAL